MENGKSVAETLTVTGAELFAGISVMLPEFVPGLSAPVVAVIVKADGVAEAMPLVGDI